MDTSSKTRACTDHQDLRVMILAPSGRDADLAERELASAGLRGCVCADLDRLRREIAVGAGAVLIAEEALAEKDATDPEAWIGPEPQWSSLPLVVLTGRSPTPQRIAALRRLEHRPNVSFLERPTPKRTLISTLRTAIESRRRQYAMRDFLDEQLQLQHALQKSERRANRILESIADGFIAIDWTWRITYVNAHAEEFLRPKARSRKRVLGNNLWTEFPDLLGTQFETLIRRVSDEKMPASVQAFYPPLDAWFDVRAYASSEGVSFHFLDISDRKRAEKHRELLIDELNHRVKNTLAIVQAVAQQTFRGTDVPAELGKTFQNRLAALAAAHNLLTRSSWEHTSLEDVAGEATGSSGARSEQVSLKGPHVVLEPKKAVTFAMALHELCTNSLKYGALSSRAGHVDVEWSVSDDPDPQLRLVWLERGGPPVEPPRRKGFGSRMIEQGLAQELDGEVTMEFRREGMVCTIEGTLSRMDAVSQ